LPLDAPTAFFSYSREDSDFALKLAQDLRDAGACVWLDQLDIEPGQEWDSAVEDAVMRCQRMLLILSPASVKSRNVRDEITFALDEKKIIIPVLYQDAAIPLQLIRIQHTDFRTDYDRGLKILLKALGVGPQAAASAAAATAAPVESQPVVSDAERKGAAERAQLEEGRRQVVEQAPLEQKRSGAPAPSLAIVSPTLKKIAVAVCGILVVALIVYWATRPKQQQGATQTPVVQTQPSSPPPSAEVSPGRAAAEKAVTDKAANKLAADKASADKAAARKAAADRAASDKAAADKAAANKAAAFRQPATEPLSAQAMFDKGNEYYFGRGVSKDYKQAFSWFRKAADAGNTTAMANLGVMYEHGYGVETDYNQALTWNRKAAEAGDANGMNNLGFMYRYELGVAEDYPKAFGWFRKAAEAGSPFGMDNLAEMYENGYGVEKDPRQAINWYRKAAQLGDQPAKNALKRLGASP